MTNEMESNWERIPVRNDVPEAEIEYREDVTEADSCLHACVWVWKGETYVTVWETYDAEASYSVRLSQKLAGMLVAPAAPEEVTE